MKSFIIREGIVWLALIALTSVGFANAGAASHAATYLVVAIGFMKFAVIFFDFMGMKRAHRAWHVTMILFMVTLFSGIAYWL